MDERFIRLTTENEFTIISYPEVLDKGIDGSFNDMVHREIDCMLYESVCLRSIYDRGIVMLVDESGLLVGKKPNLFPWLFYSGWNIRAPIVGDVLFVGEHRIGEYGELDFCGLSSEQIDYLVDLFKQFNAIVECGKMVELWIRYYRLGETYIGKFTDMNSAFRYYRENRKKFYDPDADAKGYYKFALPIYKEVKSMTLYDI